MFTFLKTAKIARDSVFQFIRQNNLRQNQNKISKKIRQIVVCQKSVRKEENDYENSRQNTGALRSISNSSKDSKIFRQSNQSQNNEINSQKRNNIIQPNRCHPGLKKEGKAKNRTGSLWRKMRHQDWP